jgi:hypothetical protein
MLLVVVTSAAGAPAAAFDLAVSPELHLVRQTSWVPQEGTFDLAVRVDDPPAGGAVRVTVEGRVVNRSEFALSLTKPRLHSAVGAPVLVPIAADGPTEVSIPTRTTGDDPDRLRLSRDGVYPVVVELLDRRGATVDQIVTHLVLLPPTGDTSPPLQVAMVVPVDAAPATRPSGSISIADRDLRQLDAVIGALADHPDVPLVVDPTPETLDALATKDAPLLDTLRRALSRRQVLAPAYARVQPSAYVEAGAGDELAAQLTRGADLVADTLQVRGDARTWLAGHRLTTRALTELRELGVDQVIVPEASLEPLGRQFRVTLARPFEIETSTERRVRAVQADTALTGHLASTVDPVLAGHRLLADLAVIYFDNPSLDRGVVVRPPEGWRPTADLLDVVLGGLRERSVIDPVTVDELFRSVPLATEGSGRSEHPLTRELEPTSAGSLGTYPDELATARRLLTAYRSLVGPDSPLFDPYEKRLLVGGDERLTNRERVAYVDQVTAAIRDELAEIQAPARQTITLTARKGTIPLTLRNTTGHPVHVVVHLDSDKLDFPRGAAIPLQLDNEATRIDIAVEARASGAFPLDVVVTSPDGALALARSRFTIRSTAFSGVGIVLSAGAGVFLLVWWARNWSVSRRARHLAS